MEPSYVESPGRGIDLLLGESWPGFNETLSDCVSSMAPRGDRSSGLSTYWIDLLLHRLESWVVAEAGAEMPLMAGNISELLRRDDVLIARALYDTFDDEVIAISTISPLLHAWRDLVVARGGDFDIPEAYRRNPYLMPRASSDGV